jgi:hypothetical protein
MSCLKKLFPKYRIVEECQERHLGTFLQTRVVRVIHCVHKKRNFDHKKLTTEIGRHGAPGPGGGNLYTYTLSREDGTLGALQLDQFTTSLRWD